MAFPSTFLSLQDSVINKLRLQSTDRAKVKDWLNQVYAQVCVETECLQTWTALPTTGNYGTYTLPAGVLRIKALAPSGSNVDYAGPLQQVSLDEILNLRVLNTTAPVNNGAPAKYALAGMNQLELWPTPTVAGTLLIYYVALPNALNLDADVPILQEPYGSKLLEAGATAEAAEFVNHPDAGYYRQLHEDWTRRFKIHLNRRRGRDGGQVPVGHVGPVSIARDIDLGR